MIPRLEAGGSFKQLDLDLSHQISGVSITSSDMKNFIRDLGATTKISSMMLRGKIDLSADSLFFDNVNGTNTLLWDRRKL